MRGSFHSRTVYELLNNLKLKHILTLQTVKSFNDDQMRVLLAFSAIFFTEFATLVDANQLREKGATKENFVHMVFARSPQIYKIVQRTLDLLHQNRIFADNVSYARQTIQGLSLSNFSSNSVNESVVNLFCFVRDFIDYYLTIQSLPAKSPFDFNYWLERFVNGELTFDFEAPTTVRRTTGGGSDTGFAVLAGSGRLNIDQSQGTKSEQNEFGRTAEFANINAEINAERQPRRRTRPSNNQKEKSDNEMSTVSRQHAKKLKGADLEEDLSVAPQSQMDAPNRHDYSQAQSHSSEFHVNSEISSFSKVDVKVQQETVSDVKGDTKVTETASAFHERKSNLEKTTSVNRQNSLESSLNPYHDLQSSEEKLAATPSEKLQKSTDVQRNTTNLLELSLDALAAKKRSTKQHESRDNQPKSELTFNAKIQEDDFDYFFNPSKQNNEHATPSVNKDSEKDKIESYFGQHDSIDLLGAGLPTTSTRDEPLKLAKDYKSRGEGVGSQRKEEAIDFLNNMSPRGSQTTSHNRADNFVKMSADLIELDFAKKPAEQETPMSPKVHPEERPKQPMFIHSRDLYQLKNKPASKDKRSKSPSVGHRPAPNQSISPSESPSSQFSKITPKKPTEKSNSKQRDQTPPKKGKETPKQSPKAKRPIPSPKPIKSNVIKPKAVPVIEKRTPKHSPIKTTPQKSKDVPKKHNNALPRYMADTITKHRQKSDTNIPTKDKLVRDYENEIRDVRIENAKLRLARDKLEAKVSNLAIKARDSEIKARLKDDIESNMIYAS